MRKIESNSISSTTLNTLQNLRSEVLASNADIQMEHILRDSPYSDLINTYISNYREFNLYYTLKLQEAKVTRAALIKDIDFDLWITSENATNRDLMLKGRSPYAYDGEDGRIELHHIGQQYDAPFAELTVKEHMMYGNNQIFHTSESESWRNDNKKEKAFLSERTLYWKKRAKKQITVISSNEFKDLENKDFQLPAELREKIIETVELLFNECTVSDLDYLSDLAKSYSLVKQTGVSSISELIITVRTDTNKGIRCSNCKSNEYVLYGTYSTVGEQIQRYKCKNCGIVFTATSKSLVSGSSFAYIDWIKFIDCLYNGYSIKQTAKACGISERTAHENRVKLFYALKLLDDKVKLKGNVVLDETYYPVSFKGNHSKEEGFLMPRTAHKRGHENHQQGITENLVCIACALDDEGNSVAHVTGTGLASAKKLANVLETHINKESVFCLFSDKSRAIGAMANKMEIEHHTVKLRRHKETAATFSRETFVTRSYLQRINAYHSRLKRFLNNFYGTSTKLLSGYLYLFAWKERNSQREPIEAYKELLAVMTEPNLYLSADDISKNDYLPDALTMDKQPAKANFPNLERDKEIYRRFAEGESMTAIGKDYGYSRQRISQIINKLRKYGLAYKTKAEIKKDEERDRVGARQTNSSKAIRKLTFNKRYFRENNIYYWHNDWTGTQDEFYDAVREIYHDMTNVAISKALNHMEYIHKMHQAFYIHENISYKSLEEVYREIYADYKELVKEDPSITQVSYSEILGEKYNYSPKNIIRIINIMNTEGTPEFFITSRRLSSDERIERDKAIFIDFLKWDGERHDFCLWAAEKYNLSYFYIQSILRDVLTADPNRYDMI